MRQLCISKCSWLPLPGPAVPPLSLSPPHPPPHGSLMAPGPRLPIPATTPTPSRSSFRHQPPQSTFMWTLLLAVCTQAHTRPLRSIIKVSTAASSSLTTTAYSVHSTIANFTAASAHTS